MDPQNNYGSVTLNYTYKNQNFTKTGSFTIITPYNFIAEIKDDINFPSNCLTDGILVQVILDENTNGISSVALNFNIRYLYSSIPSSAPITNVTINGNVILNKISIPFNYNMMYYNMEDAYILYSFIPKSVIVSDCFSPIGEFQAAITNTQTAALLTKLDTTNIFLSPDQKIQIANEAAKIAAYIVSISERINNIGKTLAKR